MASPNSYPPSTGMFLVGSIIAFVSTVLLLVSFASPYWLESYEHTRSANQFLQLGLWEVCFNQFRFPSYQFDRRFDGCNYIYSEEYRVIQHWLLPGWYLFVQGMVSVALIFSFLGLITVSLVLMRFFLRFEWYIIFASFVMNCVTSVTMFLGVAVFGGMCWERSWLLYPNFNHLSWAYALAVTTFFLHGFSAAINFLETYKAKERRRKAHNIVFKMDSPSSFRY